MGAGLMILGLSFQAIQLMFNENGWVPDAWLVLVEELTLYWTLYFTDEPNCRACLGEGCLCGWPMRKGEGDDAISE